MTRIRLIRNLALQGVIANKVRSALTVLGIVIGIAAVIALLGLGEGAQDDITSEIGSLGSNFVAVIPGTEFRGPPGTSGSAEFTTRDLDYIDNSARFPGVSAIAPGINGFVQTTSAEGELLADVTGTGAAYFEVQSLDLQEGRFFSDTDVASARNVAVVGPDVLTELLPDFTASEAIGEQISVQNLPFQIVGVLKSRGESSFSNLDEEIYLPYTAAGERIFSTTGFSAIYLKVEDLATIDSTVLQIEEKFARFRTGDSTDQDFTIFTSDDIISTASRVTGIFTSLLASIAGISLVVGGIGISNIMLVSVTERTREIGLRKAIGARRSDILGQFLAEAVILTLIGGIVGIILGIIIASIISQLTGISANISFAVVALATSVSGLVGLVFGFFPAYQASRLNPIDALRYE